MKVAPFAASALRPGAGLMRGFKPSSDPRQRRHVMLAAVPHDHVGDPLARPGSAAGTADAWSRRPPGAQPATSGALCTLAVALAVGGASLLLVAPAPSYDPWAWLLWGREISGLGLSTAEGPAFKPLPVAVCALLAGLGDTAAPVAWVWLARAGAALALIASFRLARELSGGSRGVGMLAAVGVALTGSFLDHAASGLSEPMLVAFALAGGASARGRRPKTALACAAACALIRVETWPFVLLAGAIAWRRQPRLRAAMALVAGLVPLAWFGPELIGSGDLLRSGSRALVPNAGQPALAPIPALASLRASIPLVPWPLWLGVAALLPVAGRARGIGGAPLRTLAPAGVGVAWLALVAAMAQAGFSGEPRYALPGAVLVSISGAVGIVGLLRAAGRWMPASAAACAVAIPMLADPGDDVRGIPAAQAHHWALSTGLRTAIESAGGRRAVLACGRPYVGPYRGTLAAYQLGVAKQVIEPDAPPSAPGVVFQSRLKATSAPAPAAPPGFTHAGRHGLWRILASCGDRRS